VPIDHRLLVGSSPVPTIFTRIIAGEIPGRFVWRDDRAVAFLDVRPLSPGHVLVVPVDETDQWTDLDAGTATHLMAVAHAVGNAQMQVFSPPRVGLMIAGFEVPHVHIHVMPVHSMQQFDFSRADTSPDPSQLDRHADELRTALRAAGHNSVA
jgi:diadenosine tetraphosphate (Ap4A) HIT family hydrolase